MGALPVSKKERCREGKTGIGPRMKCGHATHKAKNGLPSLHSQTSYSIFTYSMDADRYKKTTQTLKKQTYTTRPLWSPSPLCIELCALCKYCALVSLARCENVHLQCDGGIR